MYTKSIIMVQTSCLLDQHNPQEQIPLSCPINPEYPNKITELFINVPYHFQSGPGYVAGRVGRGNGLWWWLSSFSLGWIGLRCLILWWASWWGSGRWGGYWALGGWVFINYCWEARIYGGWAFYGSMGFSLGD